MNQDIIAYKLKQAGYEILSQSPTTDLEDGCIVLTDDVHISVNDIEEYARVVVETSDGCFNFYDMHQIGAVKDVLYDVEMALLA